ncbi:hypothetical protein SDC9_57508 [bioreactor metagenome]|uniref:Uncharacterized protein n=1 Tax=bioreactor metagenome TaxID=1076179 RepID=A0A644X546_9ZZZZ
MNNVDTTQEYPYEYWFQFQDLDDTCTYKLTKKSGRQNSIIELYNNHGDTVIFVNIRIQNIETGSLTNLISDLNGQSNIGLEKGKYKIEISAMNYDKFNMEFEVADEQYIELKIYLGLAPGLSVYEIDSKSALTENEIFEIIDCVKKNRNELLQECSDENKYRVMLQL